jgi:hypothetical protein
LIESHTLQASYLAKAVESYEDEDAWRKKCLEEELLGRNFIGE